MILKLKIIYGVFSLSVSPCSNLLKYNQSARKLICFIGVYCEMFDVRILKGKFVALTVHLQAYPKEFRDLRRWVKTL